MGTYPIRYGEIKKMLGARFDIEELNSVEVSGKYQPHMAVKAFLKRKD